METPLGYKPWVLGHVLLFYSDTPSFICPMLLRPKVPLKQLLTLHKPFIASVCLKGVQDQRQPLSKSEASLGLITRAIYNSSGP